MLRVFKIGSRVCLVLLTRSRLIYTCIERVRHCESATESARVREEKRAGCWNMKIQSVDAFHRRYNVCANMFKAGTLHGTFNLFSLLLVNLLNFYYYNYY